MQAKISTFDHTQDHSPTGRLLAVGALAAAAVALALVLATSAELTNADSRGAAARDHIARGLRAGPGRSPRPLLRARVGKSPDSTLPFAPNRADRRTRPYEVPSLYADGLACSVGCRPYGAEPGWPLAPFHSQHPIRAGLNELRPESLHVGIDIQAADGARVYAVQPGSAQVLAASGPNARVQVGNYIYWHIVPFVTPGQEVKPFVTVLGTVMPGYGHIAFSELGAAGEYVNPLRPEGGVLKPYVDRAAPVIGRPRVAATGEVSVAAYDPQSFVRRTTYITPILAPAAIAYRLYDRAGSALTPLLWAFRGTHLLPFSERSLIYAHGSREPGYSCFATRQVCIPHWRYRVAGGLAPPLPIGLPPGRYRLTIYAWDWADNRTALDTRVTMSGLGWRG
ncbi:MAG: hypothetical protein JO153_11085 [Solirubrobacterales bacterium]|nr:hypothetical protein [Solirubrobacterales bacterium]